MAKVSKAEVDKHLRDMVFADIFNTNETAYDFKKINDRQYGVLLTDDNGEQRYIRIGAIVAELREDMTAEELMQSEITAYKTKQDEKEIKRLKKIQKIASDKAKREAEEKEKGE